MLEKPRMAVFSILGQDFCAGHAVIDAFAGTGILGFECLSRGATHATFFDTEKSHLDAIQEFARLLKCDGQIRTVQRDVMAELNPRQWDGGGGTDKAPLAVRWMGKVRVVFVDPPHAFGADPGHVWHHWFSRLGDMPGLAEDAVIVYGHQSALTPAAASGRLALGDTRTYGEVAVSFYGL
jgi:16S rRNA (guanine966-N2)-methyltransferase